MRPVLKFWQRIFRQNPSFPQNRHKRRRRLELESLESRTLLSTVAGLAFVDANGNGSHNGSDATVQGVPVTLTGTTTNNTPVNISTSTDTLGAYNFLNVQPGTYQITAGPGKSLLNSNGTEGSVVISPLAVADNQTVTQDLAFKGLAPEAISLRLFLTSTTPADLPYASPGSGTAQAGPRNNTAPVVKTAITNVSVAKNAANTVLDLAGNFDDVDMTDSHIRFDTNMGSINVELFDRAAPQTVANFFNYITSGRYDNSIFHRLASGFVLQGGGFKFQANPSTITTITTDPAVKNEFDASRSNLQGTLAMAKVGGDPNSATDQFFINLANNSGNLDNQNGGFTVFGKIDAASQSVVNALVSPPVSVQNQSASNSAFDTIPLINYSGNAFPTDTTAANYDIIKSAVVVQRNEQLTYTVTGNSNPGLVTTTITNNRLTLQYAANQTGTATITVQAKDTFGATTQTTFTVTVS